MGRLHVLSGKLWLQFLTALWFIVFCSSVHAEAQSITGVWNGFLNHLNVTEVHNLTIHNKQLRLRIKNNSGAELTTFSFNIQANGTEHIVLNGLNEINIQDQFGTLVIDEVAGNAAGIVAHTAIYRLANASSNKAIEYAYSLPAGITQTGITAGMFNSINPDGGSQVVYNWLSILNLSSQSLQFHIERYDYFGNRLTDIAINNITTGERRDIALAHEEGQVIGSYRIVPSNHNLEYRAFLSRFSEQTGNFAFAFPLEALEPSCEQLSVDASTFGNAYNWGELANMSNQPQVVEIEVKKVIAGLNEEPYRKTITLNPFSQYHIPLHEILGPDNVGSLQVNCISGQSKLILQSIFYGHLVNNYTNTEWAYASQPQTELLTSDTLALHSANTMLGAANWSKLSKIGLGSGGFAVEAFNAAGVLANSNIMSTMANSGKAEVAIHSLLGPNSVGQVVLSTNSQTAYASELIRVYYTNDAQIGSIMHVPSAVIEKTIIDGANNPFGGSSSSSSSSTSSSSSSSTSSSSSSTSSGIPVSIAISHDSISYPSLNLGENTLTQLIVRPLQGSPSISAISFSQANNFTVLEHPEVIARGGIPCDGNLTNFCNIMLVFSALNAGNYSDSLHINVIDGVDSSIENVMINATATQTSIIPPTNQVRTISLRTLAEDANQTVSEFLQAEFARMMPTTFQPSDTFMFDAYSAGGASDWANNWANSAFDFSGIAWDAHMAGTAITKCHVVFADHYPRSGTIRFHAKDGTRYSTSIVATRRIIAYDIQVGLLDPCLPDDWTTYPIVNMSDAIATEDVRDAPYINTHFNVSDFIKRISLTKIWSTTTWSIGGTYNPTMPAFMQVSAVVGDSGHPSFVVVNGKLVLMSIFRTGGYGGGGPFFGSPLVQQEVFNAISELS